jgi:cytosine/adenosine deaminase-related metal-dependent hydrolase
LSTWTLRARWVFPVSAPPIPDSVVTIDGEHILAVERPGERSVDLDLGDAAILPGLVNAHTHLDLTGMRGLAPPSPDFVGWLRQVISYRRTRSPEQLQADIRSGLVDTIRAGVTLLGDISGDGSSWNALQDAPLRAVVFRELLGLTRDRARDGVYALDDWLSQQLDTPQCRAGISPHAPYSVRWALFFHSASRDRPVTVHLAESREEMELLLARTGPFVPFLQELGVWDPEGLAEGPDHVLRLSSGANPVLFAHCNYLWANIFFPPNGTVVYCPRTHAAFGHPPHSFRDFLARGVRVALGTDSLASNPDLDLLAEARFIARQYPDVPGDVLLRMATLSGAEALGWADETGSLTPGKSADLVVVPISGEGEPHRLLFESSAPVRAVLFRGQWVHDARGKLGPVFA